MSRVKKGVLHNASAPFVLEKYGKKVVIPVKAANHRIIRSQAPSTSWNGPKLPSSQSKLLQKLFRIHNWRQPQILEYEFNEYFYDVKSVKENFRKQLDGYQHIELNFKKCNLLQSNNLARLLLNMSKYLFKLKTLKISFIQCYTLANKDFEHFAQALKRCSFKDLKFSFNFCTNISEQGFKKFSRALTFRFFNLKHLTLDFRGSDGATDNVIQVLAERMPKYMFALKSFKLYLSGCKVISGRGFELLASQALKKLKVLEHLSLYFGECKNFIDSNLQTFSSETLENLKCLKHLELSFERCFGLTNQEVESLGSCIMQHLPHLQSLRLDFRLCRQLNKQELENLEKRICAAKKSLLSAKLDSRGCKNVSENSNRVTQ